MSDNQFVSSFIIECAAKEISSPKNICEEALVQIASCDEEINKADRARVRKDNLTSVLKAFDHESTRKLRGNKIDTTRNQVDETSDGHKKLMVDICKYLETRTSAKASDIITELGGYSEHIKIYGAIKSLGEIELIERNENGFIVKGPRWEERPQE